MRRPAREEGALALEEAALALAAPPLALTAPPLALDASASYTALIELMRLGLPLGPIIASVSAR